jgi:hypothetical protein
MQMDNDREAATGSNWNYVLALLLGLGIAGAFLIAAGPSLCLYLDSDSSGYLEAARNFLAGKGLLVSAQPDQLPHATAPLSLWPPGYPMLIALGAKLLGLSPLWLAPRIGWLCWVLIPITLLYGLRPVLRDRTILVIGVLAMLAPGTLDAAPQALSDVPFLFLTALSLALFFRGAFMRVEWRLVLLSGLVGGLAYSVRNVGLALFATILAGCLSCFLMRLSSAGMMLRVMLWWFMGAALVLVPLEIRYLTVFGTLQPYHMPPSTLGLAGNIHYYVIALFDDLTSRPELKHDLLWDNKFLAVAGFVILAAIVWLRKALAREWIALPVRRQQMIVLLLCNLLAGSAIVILARSHYQWGEFINIRHLMQYDWMIMAIVALFLSPLTWGSRRAATILGMVALLLLGLRVSHAADEIGRNRQQYAASLSAFAPSQLANETIDDHVLMQQRLSRDGTLVQAIRNLPPDTLLLSNRYEALRVETGRPVTRLQLAGDCKLPAIAPLEGPALLLLFPDRDLVRSGCWARLSDAARGGSSLLLTRPYLSALTLTEAGQFR